MVGVTTDRGTPSLPPTPHTHALTADTDGFVKVLSDAKTDRVLGVHIIGSVSHLHTITLSHPHTLTDSR